MSDEKKLYHVSVIREQAVDFWVLASGGPQATTAAHDALDDIEYEDEEISVVVRPTTNRPAPHDDVWSSEPGGGWLSFEEVADVR